MRGDVGHQDWTLDGDHLHRRLCRNQVLIEQHPLWDHVQVSFAITNKDIRRLRLLFWQFFKKKLKENKLYNNKIIRK